MIYYNKIDWNQASKLGLIQRINSEILHPLGLAMTRNTTTGASDFILVAEDGHYEYSDDVVIKPILTKEEIQEKINKPGD